MSFSLAFWLILGPDFSYRFKSCRAHHFKKPILINDLGEAGPWKTSW